MTGPRPDGRQYLSLPPPSSLDRVPGPLAGPIPDRNDLDDVLDSRYGLAVRVVRIPAVRKFEFFNVDRQEGSSLPGGSRGLELMGKVREEEEIASGGSQRY